MKRLMTLLAVGSLLSLGLSGASYGQIRVYVAPDQQQNQQQYQSQQPSQPGRLTEMIGSPVFDRQANNVGTLTDVVSDPQTGQLLYGVVSSGGIFGIGVRLYAVPWQLFRTTQNGLGLDIDRNRLQRAPSFTQDNWPDLTSPTWHAASAIISACSRTVPARATVVAKVTAAAKAATSTRTSSIRTPSRDFSGTVSRIWHHAQGDLTQIAVRTEDGRTYTVAIAPSWYLDNYGLNLREGDNVMVRGSRISVNGRPLIIATRLRTDNQTLRLRERDGTPLWTQQQEQQGQPGYQQRQYGY